MQIAKLPDRNIPQFRVLQKIDFTGLRYKVYLMQSHKYSVSLQFAKIHQTFEYLLSHINVQAAERVVEQKHFAFGV